MSASKTDITVGDCLKGAFAALLEGNYATRDRLCAMADSAFKGHQSSIPLDTPIPVKSTYAEASYRDLPAVILLPAPPSE